MIRDLLKNQTEKGVSWIFLHSKTT